MVLSDLCHFLGYFLNICLLPEFVKCIIQQFCSRYGKIVGLEWFFKSKARVISSQEHIALHRLRPGPRDPIHNTSLANPDSQLFLRLKDIKTSGLKLSYELGYLKSNKITFMDFRCVQ